MKNNRIKILHILFCNRPHSEEIMDVVDGKSNNCLFNMEELMTNANERRDHIKWVKLEEKLSQYAKELDLDPDLLIDVIKLQLKISIMSNTMNTDIFNFTNKIIKEGKENE